MRVALVLGVFAFQVVTAEGLKVNVYGSGGCTRKINDTKMEKGESGSKQFDPTKCLEQT